MKYIEKMHIEGLKKFERLDIAFNPNMNIIVGENEAGKSTIIKMLTGILCQSSGETVVLYKYELVIIFFN